MVFNRGQKIGPKSGRHMEKRYPGHKIGLIYGHHLLKAGIANDWQMVQWTFAVSGSLRV